MATRGDLRLVNLVDASVNVFPGVRRVQSTDDFPLGGLVSEAVADLEFHREHAALGGRCRLALLLGLRSCHQPRTRPILKGVN